MSETPTAIVRAAHVRETLEAAGISARLLGGAAIYLTCPSARPPSPLAREYSDVDVMTSASAVPAVAEALKPLGVEAAKRFNALHGRRRLLFSFPDGMHVDVFGGQFAMCHELDLAGRLEIARETISPADLLLTKVQIAQLNRRDVLDLCALLLDWPLTDDDEGINYRYVSDLLARDWGWWRTVTENLDRLVGLTGSVGLGAARGGAGSRGAAGADRRGAAITQVAVARGDRRARGLA
jgi:hypothetical protein